MTPLAIALILIALVGGAVVGFFAGQAHRKKVAEATIGSANQEATRIINQALTTAEQKKKEAILEAKDEIHKTRTETERELRERRTEVQRQERRNIQREENLDKKTASLEKREEKLNQKLKDAEQKEEELESLKKSQLEILEKISGLTEAQAREQILSQVDEKLDHEKATRIMEAKEQIKERSDELAREIVTIAIQRCAAERTTDATVSVVSLPNDEMKGRIIGREGRNIRAIETVTGVDLIIDDTPETITISCSSNRPVNGLFWTPVSPASTPSSSNCSVNSATAPATARTFWTIRWRSATSPDSSPLNWALTSNRRDAPACSTTSVKPSTTSSKGPMSPSAQMPRRSTVKAKPSFTPSRRTTETSKRRPPSPSSYRRPMPSPPPVPAPAARTSRTTSSVWRNSKRSPTPMAESRTPSLSRPVVRSESSSNPKRSMTIRWSSSRMTSHSGSRAKWNIPDRSRSMSSGRAA